MGLWDLSTGKTTRRFEDHTKDVLSVAFSADNRQIVSAARDKTIKLWNTLAQCKYTIQEDGHQDWVSCVRFSPNNQNPIIVLCWVGQVRQGVEPDQLQAEDQPHRAHWLPEHSHHVPRWFSLRFRRQGRQGHALGPQ